MSKKWIAIGCALFLSMLFYFYEPLINEGFRIYLEGKSKEVEMPLSYESVEKTPRSLIFIKPVIEGKEGKLSAEKLVIDYDLSLIHRTLRFKVYLEHPEVCLLQDKADLEMLFSRWLNKSSFFDIQGELVCRQGVISLKDPEAPSQLFFDINHTWGKTQRGNYFLGFGDSSRLFLSFDADSLANLDIQTTLHHVEAKDLAKVLSGVIPDIEYWNFKQGILDGEFTLNISQSELLRGYGELTMSDLQAEDKHHGVTVAVEEALFKIDSKPTRAILEILQGGSLTFKDEETYAEFSDFTGRFSLDKDKKLQVQIKGLWEDQENPIKTELDGLASLPDWKDLSLKVFLSPLNPQEKPSFISFKLGEKDSLSEIALHHFGPKQFHFWQRALENFFPGMNPISYHSGILDALVKVQLNKTSVDKISLENIEAENVFLVIKPWEVAVGANKLMGHLSLELDKPIPKDTLNADIKIENGQLALVGLNFDFWNFTHVETNLSIRNGVVQQSSASVELAGLKGSAKINFLNPEEIIQLNLQGKAADLKPFLPESFQTGIDKKIAEDELFIFAGIAKQPSGFKVLGDLKTKNSTHQDEINLHFGFDLEKSPFDFAFSMPNSQALTYWHQVAPFTTEKLSITPLKAVAALESRWLTREIGIQGFVLRNGWFRVNDLPLDRFVGPFLFEEDQFSLTGKSRVTGHFDHQGLCIQYDGRNMVLDNDDLSINVNELGLKESLLASHTFDFTQGKHFGHIPIKNGTYFDKVNGLLFTDLNTNVLFEGNKIHFIDTEAFSSGIYFAGFIEIDYASPLKGVYEIEIQTDKMQGKFSQIQQFFAHFEPNSHLHIPLEADVSFRGEGGRLLFSFTPESHHLSGKLEGVLSNGVLASSQLDLNVKDLSLNFAFDYESNTLDFSDIQGTLLLGPPALPDTYSIDAKSIHFSNYRKNLAQFDISVADEHRTWIRLVGETLLANETDDSAILFAFDKELSHFGEVHPKEISLSLANGSINQAKLDANFRLSSFIYDLQKLSKSGLLFLSPYLVNELISLKNAGGDFDLLLDYDGESANLNFNLKGRDVIFDNHHFNHFALNGKKREKTWTVDQLQLDQISIAAELTKEEALWKANFLGLRYGQSLLLGLEGEYREGQKAIEANVNLLEMDLSKLHEWPELLPILEQYKPEGIVRATGTLAIQSPDEDDNWNVSLNLDTSLRSFKFNDLALVDCDHLHCQYDSRKGITLEKIKGALIPENESSEFPAFYLEKLHVDTAYNQVSLDDLKFSIPVQHLDWLSRSLSANFPSYISEESRSMLSGLKKAGILQGTLFFKSSLGANQLHILLKDDEYFLWGKQHTIKSFALDLDDDELKLATQYHLNQHLFWLTARCPASQMDRGELILADANFEGYPDFSPLKILWRKDPELGLSVQSAKGYFGGMQINFSENREKAENNSAVFLTGSIVVLQEGFKNLLDPELSNQIEKWEVGKGFALEGDFVIAKELIDNERAILFFGSLVGDDVELAGYQFKRLSSQVNFGPKNIVLSEVTITDPAGALYIDEIRLTKRNEETHYRLSIPQLTVQELRPSLLTELNQSSPSIRKPLVIHELHVQNITGILGDENSLRGHGSLNFNNPVKKHLANTIFAIPAEILTRIGLDLSVLTPVTGSVQYQIHEGKIYLTKFKDIYSHSHLSKFYLPNSYTPSYVDFDGNLNIQVRMKQYTLLFKLAEMFTVTVKGNLKKPTYTLRRQKALRRSETVSTED